MGYKWKPSASQRKAFAIRMQNPDERAAYEARKQAKAEERRATSKFDYASAGGMYIPTQFQYEQAMKYLHTPGISHEQLDACNMVISGYACNERIHHDYIHIVNELIRANGNPLNN